MTMPSALLTWIKASTAGFFILNKKVCFYCFIADVWDDAGYLG
jgi:hypothetical protein